MHHSSSFGPHEAAQAFGDGWVATASHRLHGRVLPSRRIENTILDMQNKVLSAAQTDSAEGSRIGLAVDRAVEARRATARDEVERLVAATFALIEQKGDLEPKVSDILAEAGLSNQAFYRHFRSKHELLVAVLDEGIRGLSEYLTRRMETRNRPVEAIREWVRGMAIQVRDPSGAEASRPFALARGRLAEAFPAEVGQARSLVTAPLRRALEEAAGSGALPETDPERDAEALYHLMMGWVETRLIESRIPDEDEVASLESFVMAGLARGVAVPERN